MGKTTTTVCAVALGAAALFGGAVVAQTANEDTRNLPTESGDPTDGTLQDEPDGKSVTQRTFDPNAKVYTVPAAAFTPDGLNPDSHFYPFETGYIRGRASTYGCMVAPVHLPDGVKIQRVEGSLYDNDATSSIGVVLQRSSDAGTVDLLARVRTTGTSNAVQVDTDTTVDHDVIDNANYSYHLYGCVSSSSIRLYSLRIFYQEVLVVDPHSPVLVPVTPFRVYDSRFVDGSLGEGENRLVSVHRSIDLETGVVIDNNAIPVGATAIMFNLAVTNTIGGGFLAATPGDATEFSTASINWSASGQTFNNGTFVQLDNSRRIRAFVGGTPNAETDFIIDVTGYVLPGE
ncbi:MAG: hypothetical protein HKN44_13950 [Ilumatobacter sp.]|nr:hypothetical protein [Ilumatobacter sp.]